MSHGCVKSKDKHSEHLKFLCGSFDTNRQSVKNNKLIFVQNHQPVWRSTLTRYSYYPKYYFIYTYPRMVIGMRRNLEMDVFQIDRFRSRPPALPATYNTGKKGSCRGTTETALAPENRQRFVVKNRLGRLTVFRPNSLCWLRSTARIPGCAISAASSPTAGRKTTSGNCFCRSNTAVPSPPCSALRSWHSARHPCCTDTGGWHPGRSQRRARTGPGRRARAPAYTGTGISRPQSFSDTCRS